MGREKKKIKILKKVSPDSDDRGEEGPQSGNTPDERPVSDGGDAPRLLPKPTKWPTTVTSSTGASTKTKTQKKDSPTISSY